MTSDELTNLQRRILEVVCAGLSAYGSPPPVREIARAVGLGSVSSIYRELDALRDKGFIRRSATAPRTIEVDCPADQGRGSDPTRTTLSAGEEVLASADSTSVAVPLVGQIAAGMPILADELIEDVFAIPQEFVGGGGTYFMLRVRGDSMIDAGILDGDYVIVRRQATAEHGDLVAARIEDEATVKRLDRQHDRLRLVPANPAYEAIEDQPIEILGTVATVIRHYRAGRPLR
jgi:repressor LexA